MISVDGATKTALMDGTCDIKYKAVINLSGYEKRYNYSFIQDLSKWQDVEIQATITYNSGTNTISLTPVSGRDERLWIAVPVVPGKDYGLSMDITASSFTEISPYHEYVAVLSSLLDIHSRIENQSSKVIEKTQIIPGTTDTYTVDFNSGSLSKVFLYLDFSAITDDTTVNFTISNISLGEYTDAESDEEEEEDDPTSITIPFEDLWIGGVDIDDAVSPDSEFQVGTAIINKCQLSINNSDGDYDSYIDYLEGADVELYVILNNVEYIKGRYTIIEVAASDYTISAECYDYMDKFDILYSERSCFLEYPCTVNDIVLNACENAGVPLALFDSTLKNYYIMEPPRETSTLREVLVWCAQLTGCFARVNRQGNLELKWFGTAPLAPYENIFSKTISRKMKPITGIKGIANSYSDKSKAKKAFDIFYLLDGVLEFLPLSDYDDTDLVKSLRDTLQECRDAWFELYPEYPTNQFPAVETINLLIDTTANNIVSNARMYSAQHDDFINDNIAVIDPLSDAQLATLDFGIVDGAYNTISKGTSDYMIEIANNELYQNNPVFIYYLYDALYNTSVRNVVVTTICDPTVEAGDRVVIKDALNNITYTIMVTSVRMSSGGNMTLTSAGASKAVLSATGATQTTKNYITSANRAARIETNLARKYDATRTYLIGEYVSYNNDYYKCINEIDVAEDFDETKWERITLSDEFGDKDNKWVGSESDFDSLSELDENRVYYVYEDEVSP